MHGRAPVVWRCSTHQPRITDRTFTLGFQPSAGPSRQAPLSLRQLIRHHLLSMRPLGADRLGWFGKRRGKTLAAPPCDDLFRAALVDNSSIAPLYLGGEHHDNPPPFAAQSRQMTSRWDVIVFSPHAGLWGMESIGPAAGCGALWPPGCCRGIYSTSLGKS